MMAKLSGRNSIRSIRDAAFRRQRLGQKLASTGQVARISFEPQAGAFSYPAKCVDAQTRALIDAALAGRRA